MNTTQAKKLLEEDPDWIYSKRFGYSLKNLLERYPDGCPNRIIASVLMMSEEQVIEMYKEIVETLKGILIPTLKDDHER